MKYRNYLVKKRYICYGIKQFTHKSAWWSKSYRFVPSAQGTPFPLGPPSFPFSRPPHNSPGVPPAAPRKRATTVRTLQPLASSSELSPLRGKCAAPRMCLLLHVVDACSIFPGKYIPAKKHEINGPATVQTPAWSLRHNVRPRSEGNWRRDRGREK